jgi:AraC-like DNA-binding protein
VDVTIPNVGGCFYLQFSLAGTCEITTPAGPVTMGPGSTFVIQSGLPCRLRLYPGYKSLIVRGDQTSLEDALARELGCPLSEPLIFAPAAGTEGDPAGTLASMVALMCKDLNSASPVLAGPVVGRQMEEMILHLLVRSMAHNYSAALQGPSRHSSPACLRRAEAYIAAHAREPIKLDDILRHAGASERTLHAAFRRFRHTTPMAFLRDLRLDLSRGDLLSSGSDGAKVTDVAFGCGFTHLSRFSADYKKRFGELPSATRRASSAQTSRIRRRTAR